MTKDLTSSYEKRQKILASELALWEIQNALSLEGIAFEYDSCVTKKELVSLFGVDANSLDTLLCEHTDEISPNLTSFDFRAFLSVAMLLKENDTAKRIRLISLDVMMDLINQSTGGGTKYVDCAPVPYSTNCETTDIESLLKENEDVLVRLKERA
ncbi:MAG: hypothetical protein J6R44_01950 [Clostridia bacterium]|nr:hypothetical protein [Clostridia bacterium]MBO7178413.1 hypothetical protein [Clostridia bacterium]